jgi:peptide/nickel transport system substrate-binding protein
MSRARWLLSAVALVALVGAACGQETTQPSPSPPPPASSSPETVVAPSASEPPYARAAWPASGSACDLDGYTGRIGRIEAVTPRTIRFQLCEPDGAFLARLAHPSLGIVDTSSIEALEADPTAAVVLPGAGGFRVDAWTPGDNVRLARLTPGGGAPATIILRWASPAADRVAALRDAQVDGIEDPGVAGLQELATLPEATVMPRPGMATAYLGFGAGSRFTDVAVRTAIAQGIDTDGLAGSAFPPGSTAAGWLTPCEVPGGCAGDPWHPFNGPAGVDALGLARFDTSTAVPLRIPDTPVAGLPDPSLVASTLSDQLEASLGITLTIDVMPVADLAEGIAEGTVDGLYLWGVESSLADPSGFLEPVVGPDATGTAATRARAARKPLRQAASSPDDAVRLDAFAAANDAVRSSVAVVPLAHPGSTVAFRSDVDRVAVSPLGADPLGEAIPGDRSQLVVMQATEPPTTWCGIAPGADSLRLCALVTPGLYAFAGDRLAAEPSLASQCTPSADATEWTCRLRGGITFSDGKSLDAGDVLASFAAQADASGPLRRSLPPTAFATWDALFGGPVPASAGVGG